MLPRESVVLQLSTRWGSKAESESRDDRALAASDQLSNLRRHFNLPSAHTGRDSTYARTLDAHTHSLLVNSKIEHVLGAGEVLKGESSFVYTHTPP